MAAAHAGIDGNALPGLETQHAGTKIANHAGGIAAGNLRHRHFDAGYASSKKNVEVINRCGFDFDQDLAAARFRVRRVFVMENFGPAVLVKNDCFHARQ